jgi:pimeloyl-CoA dehydrogenase small subunit
MDFDFSDEQRLLKESVDRLIQDQYGFEQRKKHMQEPDGWSRALWSQYAEMGLLALPFAEDDGGIGGTPVETMLVMEAFGRGLILEPYFATVVLGGGFLRLGGSAEQRATLIPQVIEGSLLLAFAQTEPQSRYDLFDVATTAKKDGDGWVLDGKKIVVQHGDCADKLIVSARVSGGRRDRDGIALFLVDANAQGISRKGYLTQDALRAADITLSGVRVTAADAIGEPGQALPLIERVVDAAIAALAADAVGGMQSMLDTTVEYLKIRKQFGVTIGSFQALQHKAADMLIALEQARSMAMYASMAADDADATERRKAIAATKVQIGKSGKLIGQHGVHLHGGIGTTMECSIGHYFKRATMIDLMFGDVDYHLSALAKAGGLVPVERE